MSGTVALVLFLVIACVQLRRSLQSQEDDRELKLSCWLCVVATLVLYIVIRAAGATPVAAFN